jgi:hypothetical protein
VAIAIEPLDCGVPVKILRGVSAIRVHNGVPIAIADRAIGAHTQCRQQWFSSGVAVERNLFQDSTDPVREQHTRSDARRLLDLLRQVLVADRLVIGPSDPKKHRSGRERPVRLSVSELNG